jgi:hypothetical protein
MPFPNLTPAQAAYAGDRSARVTCPHLRPIEDEAREQGIDVLLDEEAPGTIFIRALDPEPAALARSASTRACATSPRA